MTDERYPPEDRFPPDDRLEPEDRFEPDDEWPPRDEFDREPDRYAPRHPRAAARRQQQQPPWAMIIGVALLAILATVMAVLVFGGGGDDPDASPTPTVSASASASEAASPSEAASEEPSASASVEPSVSAGPTPTPVSLQIDSIVATTVGDLSVRAAPGTGSTRLGSLAVGTPGFVVAGPTDTGGYRWYLLSALGLPPNSGCAGPIETDPFNCPVWIGWVAAASQDGVPWLTDAAGDADACAEAPFAFEDIVIGVTDLMRLSCFGSDPFTFRAFWPELPEGGGGPGAACASLEQPTGWLICQQNNVNLVTLGSGDGLDGIGLRVSIDPASGVTMPARGTWLELTVHLDDPAAQSCGTDGADLGEKDNRTPEQMVLFCRGQMVVESVTAVAGP